MPIDLQAEATLAEIDSVVSESLARWGIPGATVGVTLDGETIERAYGVANLDNGQPVLTESIFRLASISKPFTATLVMTLVDEGLIDLDTPIATYLPALSLVDEAARASLTMRHLLSHTAGFDCEMPRDVQRYGGNDDALAALVLDYNELRQWTATGELWSYCNSGFWLAGAVVAAVTGVTFEQAMRDRVFTPLGLDRSCYDAAEAILHPVALGHDPKSPEGTEHGLLRTYAYPRVRRPSGGVISNVRNVLRFANAHMGIGDGKLFSDATRLAMQEPSVRLRQTSPDFWGIGWEVIEHPQGRIIGHGGSFGGFQTQLSIVPEKRFAFVVLTNSSRGSASFPLIERFMLDRFAGISLTAPAAAPVENTALNGVTGTYQHGVASVAFTAIDGRLQAVASHRNEQTGEIQSDPPIIFTPIDGHEFVALEGAAEGARLEFFDHQGKPNHLVRVGLRIAERVEA